MSSAGFVSIDGGANRRFPSRGRHTTLNPPHLEDDEYRHRGSGNGRNGRERARRHFGVAAAGGPACGSPSSGGPGWSRHPRDLPGEAATPNSVGCLAPDHLQSPTTTTSDLDHLLSPVTTSWHIARQRTWKDGRKGVQAARHRPDSHRDGRRQRQDFGGGPGIRAGRGTGWKCCQQCLFLLYWDSTVLHPWWAQTRPSS